MTEDGIDRPEVDVDELEHDATETHSDPIEGEVTRDYWECPNPECDAAICTWMDCPECLWYDEGVWERTLDDDQEIVTDGGVEQGTLTEREQEKWRELMEKPEENLTDAEKTSKIKLSIKRRYDAPEWALAFELASPDGRRADAIAVNTFPSRNFKVVGFEFKASRSDWLSEKREGAKSDYFVQACDEWCVVAWDDVVKQSELPDGWGLLELKPNSEQLWSQVDSNLPDHLEGSPDRPFWGRFVQKTVAGESNFTTQDLKEARKRGYEDGLEDGKKRAKGIENRTVKRKAERWDDLEDAGVDWLRNLNDERLRELDAARNLLRRLDEDGFRSIKRSYDDFIEDALEVESSLQQLQSAARDEGVGEDGDRDDYRRSRLASVGLPPGGALARRHPADGSEAPVRPGALEPEGPPRPARPRRLPEQPSRRGQRRGHLPRRRLPVLRRPAAPGRSGGHDPRRPWGVLRRGRAGQPDAGLPSRVLGGTAGREARYREHRSGGVC